MQIVLATANPHKVAELNAIFASAGVGVLGLADLSGADRFHEPDETGATFEENARIKARSYAKQTGRLALADDSGLEIDALRGAPGVISSHYSTDGKANSMTRAERDEANNARVLAELKGTPPERRSARFVCCMCLADPSGRILAEVRGAFEGRIGLPAGESSRPESGVPRGANGFGYDSLFLVAPQFGNTGAELAPEEKNRRSHRAQAALKLAALLPSLSLSR